MYENTRGGDLTHHEESKGRGSRRRTRTALHIYMLSHEYLKAKTIHSHGTARLTNIVCTLAIFLPKLMRGERVCGIYRGVVRRRGIAFKSICVCGVWPLVGSQVGPTPLGPSALPSPAHAHPSPPFPSPAHALLPRPPLAPSPPSPRSFPLLVPPLGIHYGCPMRPHPTPHTQMDFYDTQFHASSQRPCRCRTPSLLASICVKFSLMYKRGSSAALCPGYVSFVAFVTHERAYI
jgi:hypothetical protein